MLHFISHDLLLEDSNWLFLLLNKKQVLSIALAYILICSCLKSLGGRDGKNNMSFFIWNVCIQVLCSGQSICAD